MQTNPAVPQAAEQAVPVNLDPVSVVLHSSGPVFVVFWLLVLFSVLVWVIAILKALQLARMGGAERRFEQESFQMANASELFQLARRHLSAPGARVVIELAKRAGNAKLIGSIAKRATVTEQQRASTLMPTLGSIASSAPFIGLLGTVYGILDAFLRIGREKSASLPVVAPAIGEALIATAVGLFAAIPALIFYNMLNKRIGDLIDEVEAASEVWVMLALEQESVDPPTMRPGQHMPAPGPQSPPMRAHGY
jgi:biopolymer transport protein TolQ